MMLITELPAKSFRPRRYRPGGIGAWSGHLPFAHDLIAAMRPRLLVELGTHYGESYFGMCQAVDENAISCSCYAVDTWKGDPQAGYYDESVFEEVNRYNEEHYASFSTLLRTTFDAAAGAFGDGTIDLLHIDGLHAYEAVRHDFESWFPKVRPGGVVLLHDVGARGLDFGVWKLWEELAQSYPHLAFTHSWGLGVLSKPGNDSTLPPFLETLFFASSSEQETIRHYYALQAELLERRYVASRVPPDSPEVLFQVFLRDVDGYSEARSLSRNITRGEWQHVVLDLPSGISGPIRVDPLDRPGLVEFASIQILRAADGTVLQRWAPGPESAGLSPVTQLIPLPADGVLQFLSVGRDPQLLLPALDAALCEQSLSLEVKLRVHDDLEALAPIVRAGIAGGRPSAGQIDFEWHTAVARNHELSAEIRYLQTEHLVTVADYRRVNAENERLQDEAAVLRASLASSQARCEQLEERTVNEQAELRSVDKELRQVRDELRAAYGSLSWRLTKPLRWARRATR